ncbi:uncharacterized protein LOC126803587 [Argentina anserina]|uniref:uncharacterized protein LOC126803587 n=1 Tax=Argentina anserina TaxID=57926 RepID=UPI00217626A2|nr:uncharacterized protein LOC126803587 [Potentilla anserina]
MTREESPSMQTFVTSLYMSIHVEVCLEVDRIDRSVCYEPNRLKKVSVRYSPEDSSHFTVDTSVNSTPSTWELGYGKVKMLSQPQNPPLNPKMPKRSDTSDEETSSSGSEYEKQRQARIAQNRASQALGLPQMASSLKGSAQNAAKRSRKGKAVLEEDDDEEYRPEEEGAGSSSEKEANDDDDFEDEELSGSRKRKNKVAKRKNACSKSSSSNSDYLDDDEALKQAIALSLQDSAVTGVSKAKVNDRQGENQIQKDTGRTRKNSFTSRLQMTEDELVLHFYQLDESCNGGISAGDLEKADIVHDFTWTGKEVADMIHLFDSDGDAKLSLEDFRKIVVRCNMIKAPENV